jgi:hypothetical protein
VTFLNALSKHFGSSDTSCRDIVKLIEEWEAIQE